MTWLQPIALLGLLAVAVPILVHLLGRPNARRVRFPSLRFLELTRDAPSRRAIPSDLLLLALRMAIVALAAVALARPTWPVSVGNAVPTGVARAIVLDTSASMVRLTSAGGSMLDRARRDADSLAADASEALVLPVSRPGDALRGAAAWLEGKAGRREVVIISDFQADAVVPADTLVIPPAVGLAFVRLTPASPDSVVAVTGHTGNATVTAEAIRSGGGTRTRWTATAPRQVAQPVRVLAGEAERPAAEAALAAARATIARRDGDPGERSVVIVLPGHAGRTALLDGTRLPDEPWQGEALFRISRHPVLAEASRDLRDSSGMPGRPGLVPLARHRNGTAAVVGGVATIDGSDVLALYPATGASVMLWAALAVAADGATMDVTPVEEQDPAVMPDAALAALARAALPGGPSQDAPSMARWLWLAALVLLGIEWLLRRRPSPAAASQAERVTHERVA
jgi:hypothetical protein